MCSTYPNFCYASKDHDNCHKIMQEYYREKVRGKPKYVCPECQAVYTCSYEEFYSAHIEHLCAFSKKTTQKKAISKIFHDAEKAGMNVVKDVVATGMHVHQPDVPPPPPPPPTILPTDTRSQLMEKIYGGTISEDSNSDMPHTSVVKQPQKKVVHAQRNDVDPRRDEWVANPQSPKTATAAIRKRLYKPYKQYRLVPSKEVNVERRLAKKKKCMPPLTEQTVNTLPIFVTPPVPTTVLVDDPADPIELQKQVDVLLNILEEPRESLTINGERPFPTSDMDNVAHSLFFNEEILKPLGYEPIGESLQGNPSYIPSVLNNLTPTGLNEQAPDVTMQSTTCDDFGLGDSDERLTASSQSSVSEHMVTDSVQRTVSQPQVTDSEVHVTALSDIVTANFPRSPSFESDGQTPDAGTITEQGPLKVWTESSYSDLIYDAGSKAYAERMYEKALEKYRLFSDLCSQFAHETLSSLYDELAAEVATIAHTEEADESARESAKASATFLKAEVKRLQQLGRDTSCQRNALTNILRGYPDLFKKK